MDYKEKYLKYKIKYLKLKNTCEIQTGGTINTQNNYTIIKEIGIGMIGTVYLVKNKSGKHYAMKIEKIFKEQANKSLKYRLGREIEFSNKMSKLYPQHFIKIENSWINNNCTHEHNLNKIGIDIKLFDKQTQLHYKKLFDSSYCSIKIYSLVDLTLKDLVEQNNITCEEYYDFFIQSLYVMYICNKKGYLHQDWKMDNIGLIKTNKKYIDIFDKKILTHGYIVVLIDYGGVIHNKYILSNYEKKILKNNLTDLFFMFDRYRYNMIYNFYDFEDKYNIDTFNHIKINSEMKKEIKQYLPENNKMNNNILSQYIYKILFYDKFEKQLINQNINFNNNTITETINLFNPLQPKLLIPLNIIKFLIKNIYDIKKCINFMLDNKI